MTPHEYSRNLTKQALRNMAAEHCATRYRLIIRRTVERSPLLRVVDRDCDNLLVQWQGTIVNHLLESNVLPNAWRRDGDFYCDKFFVRHLAMAGAALTLALDQVRGADTRIGRVENDALPLPKEIGAQRAAYARRPRLDKRLRTLGIRLSGVHRRVAQLLFTHPGHHFCAADVRCLAQLERLPVGDQSILSCLENLTRWGVIQRIAISSELVFYDIYTFPHLHVFDPLTRELRDATVKGVVNVTQKRIAGTIEVTGSTTVEFSCDEKWR